MDEGVGAVPAIQARLEADAKGRHWRGAPPYLRTHRGFTV